MNLTFFHLHHVIPFNVKRLPGNIGKPKQPKCVGTTHRKRTTLSTHLVQKVYVYKYDPNSCHESGESQARLGTIFILIGIISYPIVQHAVQQNVTAAPRVFRDAAPLYLNLSREEKSLVRLLHLGAQNWSK